MIKATVRGSFLSSWTAVLVVLVVVVAYHLLRRRKRSTIGNLPPAVRCNPLMLCLMLYRNITADAKKMNFFCTLQYLCAFCEVFRSTGIFGMLAFHRYFFIAFKPETVEVVLKSSLLVDKSKEYKFLEPWLGKGILTSGREEWLLRRKRLMPSFYARLLDDYLPILDEQSRVLVSNLQSSADQPWVDIEPLIKICALEMICQTAMGVAMNAQTGGGLEYMKAITDFGKLLMHRFVRPWIWLDVIYFSIPPGRRSKRNLKLLHAFTRKVIREKKLEMFAKGSKKPQEDDSNHSKLKKHKPCLELLLEHHLADSSFTEENVREEVDTLMSAGHDATSMGIIYTLFLLSLHPEIQERCLKEIDCVFEGDDARPVTREDINRMTYLECVAKEAKRLYPPIPIIAREIKEDTKFLEYDVPAGSCCLINIYSLHRDPESFENPEKFEPERFLPENSSARHPYAYIPFAAGPRNCIGRKLGKMILKVVLANVLRHFCIESLDTRDRMNLEPDILLRNVDPIRMRFLPLHPRH